MSKIFLTKEEIKAELLTHTFLDPRYDACFKLLIADESHPERLVHFLNTNSQSHLAWHRTRSTICQNI